MLQSYVGGLLVGTAAVLLLLGNGRIAGISGIVGNVFAAHSGWRWGFLVGLLGGGVLFAASGVAASAPSLGWTPVVIAGVLVGAGTRLGNGCTSGHGICGVARLSRRSLAATATFVGVGLVTGTIVGAL